MFNTARREGRALWLFEVRTPGVHRLALDFDTSGDWRNTLPGNVAISRGRGLPVAIARPMVQLVIGGFVIAAVVAGSTFVRRRRHYERAAMSGSRR